MHTITDQLMLLLIFAIAYTSATHWKAAMKAHGRAAKQFSEKTREDIKAWNTATKGWGVGASFGRSGPATMFSAIIACASIASAIYLWGWHAIWIIGCGWILSIEVYRPILRGSIQYAAILFLPVLVAVHIWTLWL